MKKFFKLSLVLLVGFIGGIAGNFAAPLLYSTPTTSTTAHQSTDGKTTVSNVTYDNETSVTKAVKTVQDAVVSVINYQPATSGTTSIFGNSGHSDELEVASEGSGVVYKKDGDTAYIVTNTHVIAGAEKIDILLSSGEKIEGKLVGSDTYSDIAVISVNASKITTVAEFADSDSINVGETAIAIGSPLGTIYANSVTQGIVSSLSRTVTSKSEDGQTISTNAIQTDTAINPGNSGGPLINIQGQVIGITSSKIATTSAALNNGVTVEGLGFAIPSNDAVTIINQLEKNGKVIRPALGIQMANVTDLSTNQLATAGLEDSNITSGVLVVSTQAGLPADGNFERYDVITAIDGDTIESTGDLQSALYKHSIGDTIEVSFMRNGKKQTVKIELNHSTEDLSQ
ncbi:PDZ domain-containing protein [Streptococcus sp. X16XC17]|uniref:S1C family serine protease n=1 Tax=unclassified Streptococcus TaxID=2608887 RepID=UPI00066FC5E0|nr:MULTISPECIES: trypsin-like peptidase domain-containing protein [unclassified Streptococcus]TCD45481.1 PDZ domain-containing protein [Streptococcus sp. X16XC17]